MTLVCQKCQQGKPVEDFHRCSGRPTGRQKMCKTCTSEFNRDWWARLTPTEKAERSFKNGLWTRFRMTPEQYRSMFDEQGGRCHVCARPGVPWTPGPRGRQDLLVIDHDRSCCSGSRSCGKCVRGLLCWFCNSGLGHFFDNPDHLRSAADYLERSAGQSAG